MEKTAVRMGENNSKGSNWQRTNLKNIQATPAAQFQKNKWPNQKMGCIFLPPLSKIKYP